MTALALSVVTFFSTALGGWVALRHRGRLFQVVGFAAGLLIATAFLELLPEAVELAQHGEPPTVQAVYISALLGFLAYFALDVLLHRGAAGHQGPHHPAHLEFGTATALGLCIHSFLDGFAIGGAFQAGPKIGVLVALAVIAHDFGDGVSTVGVVLSAQGGTRSSVAWLLADAAAPIIGCAAALGVQISEGLIAKSLGFFAGSFLFIGAAHLLPEAQQEAKGRWLYPAVFAGFGFALLADWIRRI
jgi:zinc transporter, ZIP family